MLVEHGRVGRKVDGHGRDLTRVRTILQKKKGKSGIQDPRQEISRHPYSSKGRFLTPTNKQKSRMFSLRHNVTISLYSYRSYKGNMLPPSFAYPKPTQHSITLLTWLAREELTWTPYLVLLTATSSTQGASGTIIEGGPMLKI